MLDEWSDASARGAASSVAPHGSGGGLQTSPFFSVELAERGLPPPGRRLTCAAAARGAVVAGSDGGALTRVDLSTGDTREADACAPHGVLRCWARPDGRAALAATAAGTAGAAAPPCYVGAAWRKGRPLTKLRGMHEVTAACWPPGAAESSDAGGAPAQHGADSFFVGTASGSILSVAVDADGAHTSAPRLLTEASGQGREAEAVVALAAAFAPDTGAAWVAAATPARLLLYSDPAGSAEAALARGRPSVVELPSAPGGHEGELLFHLAPADDASRGGDALRYAWFAAPGVYHGEAGAPEGGVLMPYPPEQGVGAAQQQQQQQQQHAPPLSFAATEFHFALLCANSRLCVVSRLTGRVVFEERLDRRHELRAEGTPTRFALAPAAGCGADGQPAYLVADASLLALRATNEGGDVWRALLDKGDHAAALARCTTEAQRAAVLRARADACFAAGDYNLAADCYARGAAAARFEEVALAFLEAGQPDALRAYLLHRLDALPRTERSQITMLVTWLLELYLDKATRLQQRMAAEERAERHAAAAAAAAAAKAKAEAAVSPPRPARPQQDEQEQVGDPDSEPAVGESRFGARGSDDVDDAAIVQRPRVSAAAQHAACLDELRSFLADHHASLDVRVASSLLASYGREDELILLAEARGDVEAAVWFHLDRGASTQALAALRRPSATPSLRTRTAPRLMELDPAGAVDLWMEAGDKLDPRALLPALARLAGDAAADGDSGLDGARREAVRYLEFAVLRLRCRQDVVHTLLVTLYVHLGDEARLMRYLATPGVGDGLPGSSSGRDRGGGGRDKDGPTTPYDARLALRLCRRAGMVRACVHIYSALGMYEEAVGLALDVSVELAKAVASQPDEGSPLRKKLWLRMARHVVEGGGEGDEKAEATPERFSVAMSFLNDAGGLLKVEDILPFFPDFAVIDDFKDAICASVEEYSVRIEELKHEMEEDTRRAEAIRADEERLAQRCVEVGEMAPCARCGGPVTEGPPRSAAAPSISATASVATDAGGSSGGIEPAQPVYSFPDGMVFHRDCLLADTLPHLGRTQSERAAAIRVQLTTIGAATAWPPPKPLARVPADVATMSADELEVALEGIIGAVNPRVSEMAIKQIAEPFVRVGEDAAAWAI